MNNKWVLLLVCLLLSSGTWLIHNLSQSYVSIVSVQVQAQSNLNGRAAVSYTNEIITAQVRATGFQQVFLRNRRSRPVMVSFAPDDFVYTNANFYAIPTAQVLKYSAEIFGDGVVVESVISQDPKFAFAEVSNKRVPIRKIRNFSFKPQYTALSPLSFTPDSVTIYGEPSRIAHVDYINTKPLSLQDLSNSVHGKVKLDIPRGLRCSDEEVIYSMEVTRYVELAQEQKVKVRNVPHSLQLAVLPSTVKLVYKCQFPVLVDPRKTVDAYIDYEEFTSSINGRCVVHIDGIPNGTISCSVEPEVLDCMLRSY